MPITNRVELPQIIMYSESFFLQLIKKIIINYEDLTHLYEFSK